MNDSATTVFSKSPYWNPGGGFGVLVALGTLGAGGLAVVSLAAGSWWALDLVTPFQLQYAVSLLVASLWFAVRKRWFWLGLAAVFFALPTARLVPCFRSNGNAGHGGAASLKLLSFNVLCSNDHCAELLDWVRKADPDVAFFAEVDPKWEAELEKLRPTLPYHAVIAREDNFGVAVLSKLPLRDTRLITAGDLPTAAIRVEIEVSGKPLVVVGAHPPPPLGPGLTGERNRTLVSLANEARQNSTALVVMGDFNATPWCDCMRPLYEAGLRDARRGPEFGPTWRRANPLFAIPIDHILVKGAVSATRCQTGPDLGSDHRPLLAELRL